MAKKSFLIIGLGRFGTSLATHLAVLGHEVMAVDRNEENVSAIADIVTHSLIADASEERVLQQLGISNFDCIVIAVGDDLRSSILTCVLCKERGAKRVIAKAYDDLHAKLLLKTGADKVVMPERETGIRLAHSLSNDGVLDFIGLSENCSISEINVPAGWVGKNIRDLDVRARYRVSIIAIRKDDEVIVAIDPMYVLESDDILIIIGYNEDLKKVEDLR